MAACVDRGECEVAGPEEAGTFAATSSGIPRPERRRVEILFARPLQFECPGLILRISDVSHLDKAFTLRLTPIQFCDEVQACVSRRIPDREARH